MEMMRRKKKKKNSARWIKKREFLQLRIKDEKKRTETQSERLDPRTENIHLSVLPSL